MPAKSAAQHRHDFHSAANKFHSTMAELHRGQLKKAEGGAADNAAESARAYHEAAAAAHASMEFFHSKGMMEARKAVEDELRKSEQLQPLGGISAVTDPSKGPRPVIRTGQPQIPSADMPKVDTKFEHLVKVTDDRE